MSTPNLFLLKIGASTTVGKTSIIFQCSKYTQKMEALSALLKTTQKYKAPQLQDYIFHLHY
jgi:hypothetical protein